MDEQTSGTEENKNKLIYGGLIAVGIIVIVVVLLYLAFGSDTKSANNNNNKQNTNQQTNQNTPKANDSITARTQTDRDKVYKQIIDDFLPQTINEDNNNEPFKDIDDVIKAYNDDNTKPKVKLKTAEDTDKEKIKNIAKRTKEELDKIAKELPELDKSGEDHETTLKNQKNLNFISELIEDFSSDDKK